MSNTYDIIHSWYEESESGGLPAITEEDEGKFLTVDDGEAVWGESSGLPDITEEDEGKVLTVDDGEAVWGESSGLPTISENDENKVLTVDDGEAVWNLIKGTLCVKITMNEQTFVASMDKTWTEIKNAMDSGNIVIIYSEDSTSITLTGFVTGACVNTEDADATNDYQVNVMLLDEMGGYYYFYCNSENGYPSHEEQ